MKSLDECLKRIMDGLPEDYEGSAASLAAIHSAMRRSLAEWLAPALSARIQGLPHRTYADKKALARWVNRELRRFGLAIKSPKTGRAASLVVKVGNNPEVGCFQLRGRDNRGRQQTFSSTELSMLFGNLELVEAPTRREPRRRILPG